MKRLIKILWLSFAFVVVAPTVPMFVTGCKNPQTLAYNSFYTVGKIVDKAYSGYLDEVVAGKVGTNSVPTVSRAYNDYQLAFNVAVAAAQFNLTNAAPPNVQDKANNLLNQIKSAK